MVLKPSTGWRPELILLVASLLLFLVGNHWFLALALAGRELADVSAWWFGGALGLALVAINFLLLALLAWGAWFTPVLALMFFVTATAAHFIDSFGTFIDAAMLRNVLHTHWGEASELIGPRLLLWLLIGAALPAWGLARLPRARRAWTRALAERGAAILLALLALVAALWLALQPLSSLMRNQRELRYLVTPGNVLWSAASLAHRAQRAPAGPLQALGIDEFGGAAQHLSHWLQFRPWGQADGGGGRCFPSGHATSAFCFFSSAFALRRAHPVAARRWVWGVLVLGLLLGLVQLARGAHYPSHTLWSAWICFGLNLMMSRWLPQEAPNSTAALGQAAWTPARLAQRAPHSPAPQPPCDVPDWPGIQEVVARQPGHCARALSVEVAAGRSLANAGLATPRSPVEHPANAGSR